ncbi:MAG: N-acetylmuramoyl-L-alanine amidase [Rhodospirillales bacterium]
MRTDFRSDNFNSRDGQAVDMLVLHYTGMKDCAQALDRLCDAKAEVSAHYLIDESGEVFALVDESERAWHAGVASWRGWSNINSRSIGIELVNPGHEYGYRAFPDAQMQALVPLCQEIQRRYRIPGRNIVGHADVAPQRKMDPGELFDWAGLAGAGVGLWPSLTDAPCSEADVPGLLSEIGYDITVARAAVSAFQRHFATHRLDGVADDETRRALAALLTLI